MVKIYGITIDWSNYDKKLEIYDRISMVFSSYGNGEITIFTITGRYTVKIYRMMVAPGALCS